MNTNKHFGESLKAYLEAKGLKGTWLAKKIGKTSSAIYEYYKFKNPRQETEKLILDALEITLDELYSFSKQIVEEPTEEYKVKVIYKTKEQLDFEKERREWEIRENEYLRQINELQQARIKELEEQSRA